MVKFVCDSVLHLCLELIFSTLSHTCSCSWIVRKLELWKSILSHDNAQVASLNTKSSSGKPSQRVHARDEDWSHAVRFQFCFFPPPLIILTPKVNEEIKNNIFLSCCCLQGGDWKAGKQGLTLPDSLQLFVCSF